MKQIFISASIPKETEDFLSSEGFVLRKLRPDPCLPPPVSSHADMLLFTDEDRMLTTKHYYESNRDTFEGCRITCADITLGNRYPDDVALNCFAVRDTLYGRLESVCEDIRCLYPRLVNLSQGYAKCSTLLFDNCAVTADTGIYKALKAHEIEVLTISPGHISLPGYDYGFIGGASFVCDNRVIFFGDISAHPDYISIRDFVTQRGYNIIYTDTHPLIDLGGATVCNNC